MRQLSVPSPLEKTVTTIKSFKGVDLTNAPTNVADGRSPEAPNMIREMCIRDRPWNVLQYCPCRP